MALESGAAVGKRHSLAKAGGDAVLYTRYGKVVLPLGLWAPHMCSYWTLNHTSASEGLNFGCKVTETLSSCTKNAAMTVLRSVNNDLLLDPG